MKYFLSLAIAFCAAVTTFGAYQYDMTSDIYLKEAASLTVQFTGNDLFKSYDIFGVYVVSADGTSRVQEFAATTNGQKFDLGSFNANDTIGFFVAKSGEYTSGFNLTENSGTNKYNLEVWGANWVSPANFEIRITGGESLGYGSPETGGSTAPTGQPLPGILASILLGGSALGIAARRRAKKQ